MIKLTDKEILDFVRDNLTLDKEVNTNVVLLDEVRCTIRGDVLGDVWGDIKGDVLGDVAGNVRGNVNCKAITNKMTDEEFAELAEVYGKKETEQDIATLEKNIALMRDEELRVCVKEFFEKYLNYAEESDSGKMFHPIVVSCSRVMMTEPLNNLLARMAELSGAKPKETYD